MPYLTTQCSCHNYVAKNNEGPKTVHFLPTYLLKNQRDVYATIGLAKVLHSHDSLVAHQMLTAMVFLVALMILVYTSGGFKTGLAIAWIHTIPKK
jgi:hypothetical protein